VGIAPGGLPADAVSDEVDGMVEDEAHVYRLAVQEELGGHKTGVSCDR
jgi:hypothetical protein